MKKIEILSPCGGPESLDAALRAGADAVYLGAKKFSARHNAVNFSDVELKAAVSECHRHGVLVYLALNTLIRDSELRDAAELLELACKIGVDGIIIQDMAVWSMARTACPDMPLHASTQMALHTAEGVDEARALGFCRAVAARELSLKEIKNLCGRGIEIEVFAHGALCMCVSGRCYLSAMIGGRSANRGLCAGACRLPFSAEGKPADKYALSLKDMSYCGHVGELVDAGVSSLKIEGRMKRPEYVAAATNALKSARDGEEYDAETLRAAFSRSGFTDGYLTERLGSEMFGARLKEDVEAMSEALPRLRKLYEKPEKRFALDLKFVARRGENISLSASDGVFSAEIFEEPAEAAVNKSTTAEEIAEQLKKLGGTLYEAGDVSADIGSGLFVPLSKINAMRRSAVEKLDSLRVERLSRPKKFDGKGLMFDFPMLLIKKHPELEIRVEKTEQLAGLPLQGERVIIPLYLAEEYVGAGYSPKNASLELPRFEADEKRTAERLKFAKTLGFEMVECSDLGHIALAKKFGFKPNGWSGLNITNSLAAREYFTLGLEHLTLSPELKAAQCSMIACPSRTGAIVYGRLPLMITRNCPISAEIGCKRCSKKLTDRTGTEFPVLCHREEGYYELLNSRPIWLADRISGFNLDFGVLYFTDEPPKEVERVYKAYREGREAGAVFTRGLYFRGVD